MSAARIRAVRFKRGGFVRLLPNTNNRRAKDLIDDLKGFCDTVEQHHGDRLAGFAVVAWATDGAHTAWVNTSDGCPVTSTDAPTAAKDALMRHLWRNDQWE